MLSLLWTNLLRLGVPVGAVWVIAQSEWGGQRPELPPFEPGEFSFIEIEDRLPSWPAATQEEVQEVTPAGEVSPERLASSGEVGTVEHLLENCVALSQRDLDYIFGSSDPDGGGLDCSGTILWLLREEGIGSVPRQSNFQWEWLKQAGRLQEKGEFPNPRAALAAMEPGDLLFWRNTYDTGVEDRISHVMIYVGQDPESEKHYMFGARSGRLSGLSGAQVDFFEFRWPKNQNEKFAGFGTVPGLQPLLRENATLDQLLALYQPTG
ncbi:MAG: NlpC/P60 family protein [Verrucomicrobiota bacterium]